MAEKLGYENWVHHRVLKIRCTCGEILYCAHFTNTCDCGIDYDSSGQELAPRSQWGEETGESVADILAINRMTTEECFDTED
jgi:hypothetical protein